MDLMTVERDLTFEQETSSGWSTVTSHRPKPKTSPSETIAARDDYSDLPPVKHRFQKHPVDHAETRRTNIRHAGASSRSVGEGRRAHLQKQSFSHSVPTESMNLIETQPGEIFSDVLLKRLPRPCNSNSKDHCFAVTP